MKQVIPVFLHAQESYARLPGEPAYRFTAWSCDMSSASYIFLGKTELEFDVPSEEEIVARHAVLLREKIRNVYERAEEQASELREQLAKLESLTYTPPSGEGV